MFKVAKKKSKKEKSEKDDEKEKEGEDENLSRSGKISVWNGAIFKTSEQIEVDQCRFAPFRYCFQSRGALSDHLLSSLHEHVCQGSSFVQPRPLVCFQWDKNDFQKLRFQTCFDFWLFLFYFINVLDFKFRIKTIEQLIREISF